MEHYIDKPHEEETSKNVAQKSRENNLETPRNRGSRPPLSNSKTKGSSNKLNSARDGSQAK